jgi:hypothetical protein
MIYGEAGMVNASRRVASKLVILSEAKDLPDSR